MSAQRRAAITSLSTAALLLAGCGSGSTSTEAGAMPPLTGSKLTVEPAGDPLIQLVSAPSGDPAVTLNIDDAGLLDAHVTVRNTASGREDVILSASCYDDHAIEVATVTGGTVFLNPGETRTVTLAGRRPAGGSITRVAVHIATHPTVPEPTPTAS